MSFESYFSFSFSFYAIASFSVCQMLSFVFILHSGNYKYPDHLFTGYILLSLLECNEHRKLF